MSRKSFSPGLRRLLKKLFSRAPDIAANDQQPPCNVCGATGNALCDAGLHG